MALSLFRLNVSDYTFVFTNFNNVNTINVWSLRILFPFSQSLQLLKYDCDVFDIYKKGSVLLQGKQYAVKAGTCKVTKLTGPIMTCLPCKYMYYTYNGTN